MWVTETKKLAKTAQTAKKWQKIDGRMCGMAIIY